MIYEQLRALPPEQLSFYNNFIKLYLQQAENRPNESPSFSFYYKSMSSIAANAADLQAPFVPPESGHTPNPSLQYDPFQSVISWTEAYPTPWDPNPRTKVKARRTYQTGTVARRRNL